MTHLFPVFSRRCHSEHRRLVQHRAYPVRAENTGGDCQDTNMQEDTLDAPAYERRGQPRHKPGGRFGLPRAQAKQGHRLNNARGECVSEVEKVTS